MHEFMARALRASLIALVLLPAAFRVEAAQDPARAALIGEVLEVVRFRDALRAQEAQMREQWSRDPRLEKMTVEQRKQFEALMNRAVDPKALYKVAADVMEQNYDAGAYRAFVKVYRNPLMEKMTRLGVESVQGRTKEVLQDYAKGFADKPPAKERIDALLQLDEWVHASEIMAQTQMDLMTRVANIKPDDPRVPQLREQMRAKTRETFLLLNLYAYRSVADKDVLDYVQRHREPQVAKTAQSVVRAMDRAGWAMLEVIMQSVVDLALREGAAAGAPAR